MIATAVKEQSAVSEDINKNIVWISTDAESVAGSSNQSSHNAENLVNQSHKLSKWSDVSEDEHGTGFKPVYFNQVQTTNDSIVLISSFRR